SRQSRPDGAQLPFADATSSSSPHRRRHRYIHRNILLTASVRWHRPRQPVSGRGGTRSSGCVPSPDPAALPEVHRHGHGRRQHGTGIWPLDLGRHGGARARSVGRGCPCGLGTVADPPEPVYLDDLCPSSDSYGVGASSSSTSMPSSLPRRNGAAPSSFPVFDQARTEPTLGSLPDGGSCLQVACLAGPCFGGRVLVPHAIRRVERHQVAGSTGLGRTYHRQGIRGHSSLWEASRTHSVSAAGQPADQRGRGGQGGRGGAP
ncbi:unnamed protein product, partial [Urochloa humidicola]